MLIQGKNNSIFRIKIDKFKEDVFQAIIENENQEMMGEISFILKTDSAWIYSIATLSEFQGRGVGQALLDFFEYCCAIKKCYKIEGRYYPSNQNAFYFYEKNGYRIYQDGYDQFIYKTLNIENTIEKISKKIIKDSELILL